jgi:hypothetical protein
VGIFLKEMMLDHPGIVIAEPVGGLELRQCVLVESEFVTIGPGTRQLQLVEDAELHEVSPFIYFVAAILADRRRPVHDAGGRTDRSIFRTARFDLRNGLIY